MGYYTCFMLDVKLPDNSAEHPKKLEVLKALLNENECAQYALDEEGQTLSDAKWYESNEELKEFSKKFPDALLVLDGDGENCEDVWIAYFLNGKSQTCVGRMEYDDFDSSKLD